MSISSTIRTTSPIRNLSLSGAAPANTLLSITSGTAGPDNLSDISSELHINLSVGEIENGYRYPSCSSLFKIVLPVFAFSASVACLTGSITYSAGKSGDTIVNNSLLSFFSTVCTTLGITGCYLWYRNSPVSNTNSRSL